MLRHFLKNKVQLTLCVVGLVLGWGSTISIGRYLYHELTYDKFNEKYARIYRVTHNEKAGKVQGTRHLPTVGPPMGPALKSTFSQVEDAVRFRYSPEVIMRYGETQYYENRVFYADPSVFNVFSFPLLKGDAATALSLPNNVVITESMETKYFGDEDGMGKTILLHGDTPLKITGVMQDPPSNIHLDVEFLLPFEAFRVPYGYPVTLESWGWISFHTYILLREDASAEALQNAIPQLVKQHWTEERADRFRIELQPLSEIYFGDITHEQVASGNRMNVLVLSMAGLLTMIIAVFNFANLFTLIAISRAKEIGVRKVLGAGRSRILGSLNGESIFIVVFSLLLAFLFEAAWGSYLPWAASMSTISTNHTITAVGILLASSIMIGVMSGIYPSRLLVSLDFHKLLKGAFKTSKTGLFLRKGMLLGQFVVSIALVSSVFIISGQMKFLSGRDLGFEKDELIILRAPGDDLSRKFPQLKVLLETNPHVKGVSIGGGRLDGDNGNVPITTATTEDGGLPMAIDAVTFDFFKTIGITPIAGREFSQTQPADTLTGVIINEAAAKELGWTPEGAIGQKIRIGDIVLEGEVIGVVPDFNFSSLHSSIKPLVMSYPRTRLQDIYVRFDPQNVNQLVPSLNESWLQIFPEFPFDYVFLNTHLERLYQSDKTFSDMFGIFATLAIVISCLGLFGLINQDIIYRLREISIRKVLGASISQLVNIILRQFVVIMLLANLAAWPLSYFFMDQWLNSFAFHQPVQLYLFPLAALTMLAVALLAVGFNAWRAANNNPVNVLRKE
jgi:putative ABC transport system permease protein